MRILSYTNTLSYCPLSVSLTVTQVASQVVSSEATVENENMNPQRKDSSGSSLINSYVYMLIILLILAHHEFSDLIAEYVPRFFVAIDWRRQSGMLDSIPVFSTWFSILLDYQQSFSLHYIYRNLEDRTWSATQI